MATFRKYAFPKQKDADKVLALCSGTTAAVDLGIINSLICYDILWESDAPAIATQSRYLANTLRSAFLPRLG